MSAREDRKIVRTQKATGAVIYLRVSTDRQAKSGVGLESQEATCRAHCERLGLGVLSVHVDNGISGKEPVSRRPGLAGAIEAVRAAPGAVVVLYSLSRLARSQRIIWNLLDDRGEYRLPVSSATESFDTSTPMGKAMLGMLGVWAQLESDLASERTIDALEVLHDRGAKLGAPSMIERTDQSTGRRVIDEAMLATVKRIKAAYAPGVTLQDIADALNAAQVPTRTGGKWWPKTVKTAVEMPLPR